ncbi:hypothetical protein ATANTOWER_010458 [Ataeniobius toweri]|uniref:Uncharacterized protein n=1 Tax=Ataeniobius toweri TaxID=208326 RepID=A0ABU7BNX6_9TELE|nr:hypothetical protein [Ataeniobius toweri]
MLQPTPASNNSLSPLQARFIKSPGCVHISFLHISYHSVVSITVPYVQIRSASCYYFQQAHLILSPFTPYPLLPCASPIYDLYQHIPVTHIDSLYSTTPPFELS